MDQLAGAHWDLLQHLQQRQSTPARVVQAWGKGMKGRLVDQAAKRDEMLSL